MNSERPLISVITVVFNAVNTLEKTICSVLEQDTDFEYILIDGGSTDGTNDIIQKYSNQIDTFISEADRGIYDAMNKGIRIAKGEWLYFLGADDILNSQVLSLLSEHLDPGYDIVFGDVLSDKEKRFNSYFGLKTMLSNTIHHQAAFYNKRLFTNFKYDINQRIMADYELNLIVYKNKKPYKKTDVLVAICGTDGISSVDKRSLIETNIIRGKHYNAIVNGVLSTILRAKYFIHYELLRKV